MEYAEQSDLFDLIDKCGPLSERDAIFLFRQLMAGVDYLHSLNVCHRDLKCENILIAKGGIIKIGDFGMAALQQSPNDLQDTCCGSPHYAAPELVAQENYIGSKSDVWSMGIILYAMLAGRLPFDHPDIAGVLQLVGHGRYVMPNHLSIEAKDLISRILVLDPEKRPTVRELWGHPLIQKWNSLDIYGIDGSNPPDIRSQVEHGPVLPDEIDPEIFRQLRIMWHKIEEEELIDLLTSQYKNDQKLFYWLLHDYRERALEDFYLHLPHSPSDFHHIRPGVVSQKVATVARTCEFDNEDGKGKSRFTVISDEAYLPYTETVQSYDPYRSQTFPHLVDIEASRALITVLRDETAQGETNKLKKCSVGVPSRTMARSSRVSYCSSRRSTATAIRSHLASTISSPGSVQRSFVRPVHKNRPSINFRRVRPGSQFRKKADCPSAEHARSKMLRLATKAAEIRKKKQDEEEFRQFSSSIHHTLEEAFKSTILPSPSNLSARGNSHLGATVKSCISLELGPPLDMSTPRALDVHKEDACQNNWAERPLPPAPPRSQSIHREVTKAKDFSDNRSVAPGKHSNHAKKDVLRRKSLVKPIISFKKQDGTWASSVPGPSLQYDKSNSTCVNAQVTTVPSVSFIEAQVSSPPSSPVMDANGKGLSYFADAGETIRIVNSPSRPAGSIPVRIFLGVLLKNFSRVLY